MCLSRSKNEEIAALFSVSLTALRIIKRLSPFMHTGLGAWGRRKLSEAIRYREIYRNPL